MLPEVIQIDQWSLAHLQVPVEIKKKTGARNACKLYGKFLQL